MVNIFAYIHWIAGSELLEHSGSYHLCGIPVRHKAQDISEFGCQRLYFSWSHLPSNSGCAGCVYAGIIGSKETKD